jgi:hypothetical protein
MFGRPCFFLRDEERRESKLHEKDDKKTGQASRPHPLERSRIPIVFGWHQRSRPNIRLDVLIRAPNGEIHGAILFRKRMRRKEGEPQVQNDFAQRFGFPLRMFGDKNGK